MYKYCLLLLPCWIFFGHFIYGQFIENFNSDQSPGYKGWSTVTGDGVIEMDFVQKDGYASILIDASKDTRNLWWAVIRRETEVLDWELLTSPGYELRSEARIRISHAPRRVNLHFNHTRTTDFHSQLMEYDIPDTTSWHVISFTTSNFDARPGDQVNAQMAMIDWGLRKFRLDIDYFRVDLVRTDTAGPDQGVQLPYHPPLDDPLSFKYQLPAQQNAMLDTQFPDVNFDQWTLNDPSKTRLLHVGGNQLVILRWNFDQFRNREIARSGLLGLPVHAVQRSDAYPKDFGMVRISEIIAGEPEWEQALVTWESFSNGKTMEEVINEQMTIDYPIMVDSSGFAWFTISYPVLQRLIDGKTLGLSIKPLGAVSASFYSVEGDGGRAAKLYFDLK